MQRYSSFIIVCVHVYLIIVNMCRKEHGNHFCVKTSKFEKRVQKTHSKNKSNDSMKSWRKDAMIEKASIPIDAIKIHQQQQKTHTIEFALYTH